MSWNFVTRRVHALVNKTADRPQWGESELSIRVHKYPTSDAPGDRGRSQRVKTWRRRVLLKKGARIHLGMLRDADDGSIAILDPTGNVVCWYGRTGDQERRHAPVIDQHVSQFYINGDIASCVPQRHLRAAMHGGSSSQEGWRLSAAGQTFWGVTDIRVMTHRDGRVQGFIHVIRPARGPSQKMLVASRPPLPRRSSAVHRFQQEWLPVAACGTC